MGGGNMQGMIKQAQKMQARMAEVQAELENETVDASAGGGMVKVTITGGLEIRSITIDPSAVDPDDVELLQDMVTAAVNEAIRAAQELASQKMAAVTGGGIPGLF